ncbi:sugar ABC transporter permease [Cellulomonas sp. NTE-D12]|uniref:carbohydrate ABC transporter permease n=1 Tax=Cellulomonas sp. NTE-D12 TaxID=2962632 RepID=UPI003081F6EA|nr:sugar ABC transporter permease [Cellulomonas sp. NTE-D12]
MTTDDVVEVRSRSAGPRGSRRADRTTGARTDAHRAPTPRPAADRGRRPRRGPATWVRGGGLSALVFGLPAIVVFGVFSWMPIVKAVVMSLQRTNLVTTHWVGLANFHRVLADPVLPMAVRNTLWFALLALVFGYPVPLVGAVLMSEVRRAKGLYSALAYLPVVVPPVVAVLLWKFFYDPRPTGVFNTVLGWVGIAPVPWLQSISLAMPSLVLEATWAAAGGTVIIYLAALTSVPAELYDAAEVDGASVWGKVWHVTLPQLRGVLFITLILQVIGTAQVFLEPYLFTGGGPNNATVTILLLIYRYAFGNSLGGRYGEATALSLMLAAVLAVLSVVYFRLTRRWSTT